MIVRVIVVSADGSSSQYVCVGSVPAVVAAELDKGKIGKSAIKYFGQDYKRKLGISDAGAKFSFKGGTEYDDLDDIEALLREDAPIEHVKISTDGSINVTHTPGTHYLTTPCFYTQDNITDVKAKIYLATSIPPYRQHLICRADGVSSMNNYHLYADGGLVQTDISRLYPAETTVAGLPIDKSLYDARESIKVEAMDVFQTLGSISADVITCVDLGTFIAPARTQLIEMLRDRYQFEMIYYGFVVKYWPQMSLEAFYDYIANESDLQHKFPDLAPSIGTLRTVYNAERPILDQINRSQEKLIAYAEDTGITIGITQLTAQINSTMVQMNTRNVFEHFHTSPAMPEIRCWIESEGKKYLLLKKHVQSSDISFPQGTLFHAGITFAIASDNGPCFLGVWPSGRYHIRVNFREEDEIGFDAAFAVVKSAAADIITRINRLGYYAFTGNSKLTPLTRAVTNYNGLNISLFWKRVMSDASYKLAKAALDRYFRAGIFRVRNVQQFEKYEFVLHKGMYQFDPAAIDRILIAAAGVVVGNQYAYLTNQQIKQKWVQNYDGRILKMQHRTSDVRFEIMDVRDEEFITAQLILIELVQTIENDPAFVKSLSGTRDYTDVKRLRKLQEQDPELYDLKRHNSDRVYSKVCQNQHQPLIYTEDELVRMSAKEKSKLTKYHNFTTGNTAFYSCPTRKFPNVGFITGVHPKNYCIPCCNKLSSDAIDSRRRQINNTCLREHDYDESTDINSRHVMSYGKEVIVGRAGKVPQLLRDLFQDPGYYIFGVSQHFPGVNNCGVVYSIAAAIGKSPQEFVGGIVAWLRKTSIRIDTLLGGILTEYLEDTAALANLAEDLFVRGMQLATVRIDHWADLFIDLSLLVYGCASVVFIDTNGSGVGINMYATENSRLGIASGAPIVMLMKTGERYYPVFGANLERYFKMHQIEKRFINTENPLYKIFRSMTASKTVTGSLPTISQISEVPGVSILIQYVNSHNMCYGCIVDIELQHDPEDIIGSGTEASNTSRHVYVPTDYSPPIQGVKVEPVPDPGIQVKLDDAIASFAVISKHTTAKGIPGVAIGSLLRFGDEGIIGARTTTGATVYISAIPSSGGSANLPVIDLTYDYREVNRMIMGQTADAQPRTDIAAAIYNNYRYRLLIIEFVNYLDRERNGDLREKLYSMISETNFKKDIRELSRGLRAMLSRNDYTVIQSQISAFYSSGGMKSTLIANIRNSTYEFDRMSLIRLQEVPRDDAKKELIAIVSEFATEGVPSVSSFPNIYLPCSESGADYCSGGKVIIKDLSKFVDILVDDIRDPLRVAYMLNNVWSDAIIDTFSFTKVPTETITIYRLTE